MYIGNLTSKCRLDSKLNLNNIIVLFLHYSNHFNSASLLPLFFGMVTITTYKLIK